jgi:hypothetical protein
LRRVEYQEKGIDLSHKSSGDTRGTRFIGDVPVASDPNPLYFYPYLEFNMTILDEKTMRVRHKQYFELKNMSHKLRVIVLHGLFTDVKKSFRALKLKAYDEDNKSLEIIPIEIRNDYQKSFKVKFSTPISYGGVIGYYLEYETEEPERFYFSTFNSQNLAVSINYPLNKKDIKPVAFGIGPNGEEKLTKPFVIEKNSRATARWKVGDLRFGEYFKFRW